MSFLKRQVKASKSPFLGRKFARFPVSFITQKRAAAMRRVNEAITLNDTENKIRSILMQFCHSYNQTASPEEQLELRITGGWVRDKLLGDESHDLDIAINVLSGQDFATRLLEWAEKSDTDLGTNSTNLHTIKKNPDKSKHLETCTTKIFDMDIDFVNLRSEKYSDDSRVPVIECGTAEEDALRRDATLNALFYNLNKEKIEDLTGRGLQDLSQGLLRTPLDPLQTFLDDPLRVLRLIRFACRFNFTIDPATLEAMKDQHMKKILTHKISRERVGVEIDKILTSNNVAYGLRLINQVGITGIVFSSGTISPLIDEINDEGILDQLRSADESVITRIDEATSKFTDYANAAKKHPRFQALLQSVLETKASLKWFWLCTILQPYGALRVKPNPKKMLTVNYVEVIIKEGLRFGKHDYDTCSNIVSKMAQDNFLSAFFQDPNHVLRSDLGLYIREFSGNMNVNVAVNAYNDILHAESSAIHNVMGNYETLLAAIETQQLQAVESLKPFIDGKVISKALQRKPGPWMNGITNEVVRWQLDNPNGSEQECLEHVKSFLKAQDPERGNTRC